MLGDRSVYMHVCVRSKYEIDEKSGGSEAWTVTREEGKLVFVLGTPG